VWVAGKSGKAADIAQPQPPEKAECAALTVTTPTPEPTANRGDLPDAAPRRLAVFGSVSAERPSGTIEAPASPAREVLERVFAEIAEQASLIARPVLDRAAAASVITTLERDELLRELAEPQSSHSDSTGAPGGSVAARSVLREALAAVRRASPGIAGPILHAAVADGLLSAAQEQRIIARLSASPAAAFRPARSPA
jgi:hypothetical protein